MTALLQTHKIKHGFQSDYIEPEWQPHLNHKPIVISCTVLITPQYILHWCGKGACNISNPLITTFCKTIVIKMHVTTRIWNYLSNLTQDPESLEIYDKE